MLRMAVHMAIFEVFLNAQITSRLDLLVLTAPSAATFGVRTVLRPRRIRNFQAEDELLCQTFGLLLNVLLQTVSFVK